MRRQRDRVLLTAIAQTLNEEMKLNLFPSQLADFIVRLLTEYEAVLVQQDKDKEARRNEDSKSVHEPVWKTRGTGGSSTSH